jgi:hypothetical protein
MLINKPLNYKTGKLFITNANLLFDKKQIASICIPTCFLLFVDYLLYNENEANVWSLLPGQNGLNRFSVH